KITELYHGSKKTEAAKEAFINQFAKGQLPQEIPTIKINVFAEIKVSDAVVLSGLSESKSQARRLIEQGGVKVDEVLIKQDGPIDLSKEKLLQVGKRKIVKVQKK